MKTKFIKIAFILLCYEYCEAQTLTTVLNKKVYEHHSSSITSMPYGYGNVNSLSAYDFVNHSFVSASSTAQNPNKDIVEHNGPYGNGGNFGITSAVSNIGGFNYTGNGTTKFQLSNLTFSNVNNVNQIVSAYNPTLASTTINNLQVGQVYVSKIRNTNQYVIMLVTQVNNLTATQINMLNNNQQFNADVFFQFDYKYGTFIPGSAPSATLGLTNSVVCTNSSIATSNTITGSPNLTYSWSSIPSNGVVFNPSNIVLNPTIFFSNPGNYSITCTVTNTVGTIASTSTLNVAMCNVGLKDINQEINLFGSAFPNPFKDRLDIETSEAAIVTLSNSVGQVIKSLSVNGKTILVTNDLPKALYVLTIKTQSGLRNIKLIKE